jgi:hypothetical protein
VAVISDREPRSGLRNPAAAVRGVGAAALAFEALVMLLAIVPLRVLGETGGATATVLATFAVLFVALIGILARAWAWPAAMVLQVLLFVSGFFLHWSLSVLGVLFGLAWLYALKVRRSVLR